MLLALQTPPCPPSPPVSKPPLAGSCNHSSQQVPSDGADLLLLFGMPTKGSPTAGPPPTGDTLKTRKSVGDGFSNPLFKRPWSGGLGNDGPAAASTSSGPGAIPKRMLGHSQSHTPSHTPSQGSHSQRPSRAGRSSEDLSIRRRPAPHTEVAASNLRRGPAPPAGATGGGGGAGERGRMAVAVQASLVASARRQAVPSS